MKINLIGASVYSIAKKFAQEGAMSAAGKVSRKYAAITLEDSLSLSFKELGKKAAGTEEIGSIKAIIKGMGLRAKGLAKVIMAPFKKMYNYVKGFLKKGEGAAAEGVQAETGAGAAAPHSEAPTS
jgi:hypothetical protein